MALRRFDTYQEDQLPDGATDQQGQTSPMQEIGATSRPAPYQPQQPAQRPQLEGGTQQPVQVRTFEQMQQEGLARPPMPQPVAPQMANMSMAPGGPNVGQVNPNASTAPAPRVGMPQDTEGYDRMSVAERNALSNAYNFQTANDDATADHAQRVKESGGTAGGGDPALERQQYLAMSGFDPNGNNIGAPANNATPGFPSAYDPTKPPTPQAQPSGPAQYLINGQYYDNPQGTGSPQGPANQAPGGTTPPGATTSSPGTTPTTTTPGANPTQQGGSSFDLLNSLTQGASGGGPGSQLQNATQQHALSFLDNPNPYGQQDVRDQYDWLGGEIDDEYRLGEQRIGEEMARRGLGLSTNYGGRLQDTNVRQRTAKETLGKDLAHNYAQNYGQSQRDALSAGNQIGTQTQNNAQSWLSQLMGYGQQGFNNDLATNALNQSGQNSYQDFILRLLGLGYGGAA